MIDLELFDIGYVFKYLGNEHIVLRSMTEGVYTIDIEYDPEFSGDENEVFFLSFADIENYYFNT